MSKNSHKKKPDINRAFFYLKNHASFITRKKRHPELSDSDFLMC